MARATKLLWQERPTDVANFFNPAFISMIIRRTVDGFERESGQGLPFELAFILLPMVLHEDTRKTLPTISTSMQTWLQDNREILIGFPKRSQELVPFVREGLMFGMTRKTLRIDMDGRVSSGDIRLQKITPFKAKSDEINRIYTKAEFIGRWVSQQSNSTTVFAMLGVRP